MLFFLAIFTILSFIPVHKNPKIEPYQDQNFEPSNAEKKRKLLLNINVLISKGEVLIKEKDLQNGDNG